jgi:hypothetical protein
VYNTITETRLVEEIILSIAIKNNILLPNWPKGEA